MVTIATSCESRNGNTAKPQGRSHRQPLSGTRPLPTTSSSSTSTPPQRTRFPSSNNFIHRNIASPARASDLQSTSHTQSPDQRQLVANMDQLKKVRLCSRINPAIWQQNRINAIAAGSCSRRSLDAESINSQAPHSSHCQVLSFYPDPLPPPHQPLHTQYGHSNRT